jgi:hypothetical protein
MKTSSGKEPTMSTHRSHRPDRGTAIAAAFALLAALLLVPAASADTSAAVTVTASVSSELRFALCDTDANYGSGLTSTGNTPSGTSDAIGVTNLSGGSSTNVFYHWTPSCQAAGEGKFFHVVATSNWKLAPCATENGGAGSSPTLRIANGDLRWSGGFPTAFSNYGDVNTSAFAFFLCGVANPPAVHGTGGTFDINGHYYLQVESSDQPGTFSTMTTWTLTPE